MNKQQFKNLQIGDLVEWNNKVRLRLIGVVVGGTEFKTTMCGNGTTQDSSYHQVKIKWNSYEYTSVYTENDDGAIELIILIAEAKK
tara:strand:+ start:506 stop:763 length:258 start_codon:yes stop_codon:yes gene_type:complete